MILRPIPLDAVDLRRRLELELIPAWGDHPYTRAVAGVALDTERAPMDPADERGRALALGRWVRSRIRYAPERGEIVESPGYVLRHRVADCDGMTWLLGALMVSVGLRVEVRLAYYSQREALQPFHIWPEAWDSRARVWVPVDPALPVPIGTPAVAAVESAVRAARRGV